MDESSVYWTQHAHEDQRPQFKNHQKSSTMESLHPPPTSLSPPSSSIYQTDDQLDQRLENDDDQRFIPIRQKDDVTVEVSRDAALTADTVTPYSNDPLISDSTGNFKDLSTADAVSQVNLCIYKKKLLSILNFLVFFRLSFIGLIVYYRI